MSQKRFENFGLQDWSDLTTSQGMLAATKGPRGKKQSLPGVSPEHMVIIYTPTSVQWNWLWVLASRTVRQETPFVLSHQGYGDLLQQSQETNIDGIQGIGTRNPKREKWRESKPFHVGTEAFEKHIPTAIILPFHPNEECLVELSFVS